MGVGVTELLVILGIVVCVFGTGKLRSLGGDLGGAISGFRRAMHDADEPAKIPVQHSDSGK